MLPIGLNRPYGDGHGIPLLATDAVSDMEKKGLRDQLEAQAREIQRLQELRQAVNELMVQSGGTAAPGFPITSCKLYQGNGDLLFNGVHQQAQEKGYAFVEFRSVEEASNAMALDGVKFRDAYLKVRRPNNYDITLALMLGPTDPNPAMQVQLGGLEVVRTVVQDSPHKLFIGGLPCDWTEEQVKEMLMPFGQLKAFNLVMDRGTGNSKGYAFAEFLDLHVTDVVIQNLNGKPCHTKFLTGAAPEVAAKPSSTLAASVDDLFNNHLALDLDDDCLRLLLGEDADESAPCVSAGSGKAGSGASEKSSGTAAGEADAASHEDDDIAMLFGEMRHTVGPSLEPLELHLLGTAHLHATDDADTSSEAGGHAGDNEGLATEHSGGTPTKRARQGADHESSPSGRGGLMLSMNYEKAAESINLELLASGRKACVPLFSDGTEAMLPSMLLSPLLGFADIDSPDSPHSLASGCDAMEPLSGLDLQRLDSTSKRKRAVCL
ncbi:Splicing factor U2af large subunit A [Chlorella vulgaris]